jgi:hypothetical protein
MDYRSEPATKQSLTARVAEVAAPTRLTTGQHDAARRVAPILPFLDGQRFDRLWQERQMNRIE